jgi:hypothetical protein
MSDVVITQKQVYDLLTEVRDTVQTLASLPKVAEDHEARIRAIESREDLSRRVADIEGTIESMKVRLYAIPSFAAVIAALSFIFVLIKEF